MIALVSAADGSEAPRRDGAWRVPEVSAWVLRAPRDARVSVDHREIEFSPSDAGFPLRLPFAVGRVPITVTHGDVVDHHIVHVEPAEAKLGADRWAALLEALEHELAGASVGVEAPSGGAVGLEGASSPWLAAAVIPLIEPFLAAVRAIVAEPRTLDRAPPTHVPLPRARAADREVVAWLARRPDVAAWRDHGGPVPTVPQRIAVDTLDHPANRHIAWLCRRVVVVLRAAAETLRGVREERMNDTAAWCRARARALATGADAIEALLRRTFLGGLTAAPASEAALLVVRDHPTYARAQRLGRRLLSPRFHLREGEIGAPVRPSYGVYELWTFFAVKRALNDIIGGEWRLSDVEALLTGTGRGAAWTGKADGWTITVQFNLTFSSILRGRGEQFSVSAERRPDLVVTAERGDHRAWLALDAKYRVGAAALGDALASAHLYHDALRWPAFGGRPRAALLLAPQATADVAAWFVPAFWSEHGVGVAEMAPGGQIAGVGCWVGQTLIDGSERP